MRPSVPGEGAIQVGASAKGTARVLRAVTNAVVILAPLGLVASREVGLAIARVVVGVLVLIPVVRLLWLASRWFRLRDVRYAFAAVGLVSVILGGALLAWQA